MTIHRPDWERTMSFKGWTKGEDRSHVKFTAPAKDSGNATLVIENEMWSFSPKVNKVVRIPPSMMSQSWMGSDFSHSDLSKQSDVIDSYIHTLISTSTEDGHKVYLIESTPKEHSAVVWGKEIFRVRDDYIILERKFLDQDLKVVKTMKASDISREGSRLFAKKARMEKEGASDEYTQVVYDTIKFDIPIDDRVFTLSSLQK